ncbi:hypothetical protein [Persicobacter psychrovividus]|uniref:Outer membrane protein beta-barrel domain-containing protein n=1 Tax=Persicobacter psychrovividus TaxID=387638 RepID=A0ABM7VGF6_9BACT|nr:hypothetical protein PEPS_23270 [Persicobacter psychrovividus]
MIMLKKTILFLLLTVPLSFAAFAQVNYVAEEKPPLKDRLFFGGNLGLSFGTITSIEVSPLVGVMINPKLSAGGGFVYQYFQDKRFTETYSSSIYGGRAFVRYNLIQNFFLRGEYEVLNLEVGSVTPNGFELKREWIPSTFLGAGYFQPFGQRGGISFAVLYNLTFDRDRSPYAEPYVIRVGFTL